MARYKVDLLSPEDIEYIITAYCLGKKTRFELSVLFNLSEPTIRDITNEHVAKYLPKVYTQEQLEEIRDAQEPFIAKKYHLHAMVVRFLKRRIYEVLQDKTGIKMHCWKCYKLFMRLPDITSCPHCGHSLNDTATK